MRRAHKFDLEQIKNKHWYHQRFDGCPMFMWFIVDAEDKQEQRRPVGSEANVRIAFFEPVGKGDWYMDLKDVRRGARAIVLLAKRDSNVSKKLLALWKKDETIFEQFFLRSFPKMHLSRFSTPDLLTLWKKYYQMGINRFTSSLMIDHFALGTDGLIEGMLRKELRGARRKQSEFTELFSIATAPVHQSFINKVQIDLLKIILGKSKQTLKDYQKRYFWTKNNYYLAQTLSVRDFQKEVKAWKASRKDLHEELRRIENTPRVNKIRKTALFKRFHLSTLLRRLIKISEDFTWWQDERKKATYQNIHMGTVILREIGKRTGYMLSELKYALPMEIEGIINDRAPSRRELRLRMKGSVFVVTRSKVIIQVEKKEVGRIRRIALGNSKKQNIMDFRGLSASVGKAVGRARIVKSATEIDKVKQGDILVAVMTRPDYVAAMKRAAAIVTNEGGITSHAAIVSRELGIPCIIGTKIATEVLKDGDLVEVNANHGWVRKLK